MTDSIQVCTLVFSHPEGGIFRVSAPGRPQASTYKVLPEGTNIEALLSAEVPPLSPAEGLEALARGFEQASAARRLVTSPDGELSRFLRWMLAGGFGSPAHAQNSTHQQPASFTRGL